jgi:predicted transposase YbfD/YdcC
MDVGASRGVLRILDQVEDPRMNRTKRHELTDMLFLTLCAVTSGADGWTEVELYGQSKLEWLRQFVPLVNGIPSHDTLGRVFARLDPPQLENCFLRWMSALAEASAGRLIAIDGKTIRRSFDKASGKAAIHMVSAWCDANHLVLGQVSTEEKSNEITAIPQLLEMLDIRDAVVTTDAMGCQKAIAEKIVERKGHYVLQLKENQPGLHHVVKEMFDELTGRGIGCVPYKYHEETNGGHGRVETRRIWTTDWTDWYQERQAWAGLKSFACVESIRQIGDHRSVERRYFISDLDGRDAKAVLGYVRGHWGIENKVHWCLDMTFREDTLRNRVGHSAENLSRIRRIALNLLRRDKTCKVGAKGKRLKAAMDTDYLLQVLCQGI